MFQKGHKKIGGKQTGTPNKTTKVVREVFTEVFHALQTDPKANLKAWGLANTTEFYKLTSKLIPEQIAYSDRDGNDIDQIIIVKNE